MKSSDALKRAKKKYYEKHKQEILDKKKEKYFEKRNSTKMYRGQILAEIGRYNRDKKYSALYLRTLNKKELLELLEELKRGKNINE